MTYVQLKDIDQFIDRHGKLRTYYRKGKGERVALPGEPGSPEFILAYETAARGGGRADLEPSETKGEGFRSRFLRHECDGCTRKDSNR